MIKFGEEFEEDSSKNEEEIDDRLQGRPAVRQECHICEESAKVTPGFRVREPLGLRRNPTTPADQVACCSMAPANGPWHLSCSLAYHFVLVR